MTKHVETNLMRRVRMQKEALSLVQSGYSFCQVAEQLGVSQPTVGRWAKQAGLTSPAITKWSDLSHRAALAKRVRAAGGSWQDVADAWAVVEGFAVRGGAAYLWTSKNAPDVVEAKKGRPVQIRALVAAYSAGAVA